MCGIVGVLSTGYGQGVKLEKAFLEMLYVDALRGWDSTGVAGIKAVGKEKSYSVMKRALPAHLFIQEHKKDVKSLLFKHFNYIGHNRAATAGDVDDVSAHPFDFSNVLGVHNGTIWNKDELKDGNKFEVDSQAIFNSINEVGEENTIELLDGAFALLWWDKVTGTFKAVRNSERPLSFTTLKDSKAVAIASEIEMSDWVLNRNNIKDRERFGLEKGDLIEFSPDDPRDYDIKTLKLKKKIYQGWYKHTGYGNQYSSVKRGKEGREYRAERVKKRDIIKGLKRGGINLYDYINLFPTEFVPYSDKSTLGILHGFLVDDPWMPTKVHGIQASVAREIIENEEYRGQFQGVEIESSGDELVNMIVSNTAVVKTLPAPKEETKEEEKKIHFVGPQNSIIDRLQWEILVKDGCCFCSDVITEDMDGKVVFSTYSNQPICPACVEQANSYFGV